MTADELNELIQSCTNCNLCKLKYNIYDLSKGYGKLLGNGGSEIMVVAQNPSINRYPNHKEAMGSSTNLIGGGGSFRKMLIDLGIDMSKIYWTNIVKCSTENNVAPERDIIDCCSKWLLKEIEIVKPKKIVAMGGISYNYLFDKIDISKLWHYSYVNKNLHLKDQYKIMCVRELSNYGQK